MASFRTHISFGIAGAILGIIGMMTIGFSGGPQIYMVAFTLFSLGSILPDMDSDSSIPFHVAFGSLSIVSAVLMFFYSARHFPGDWVNIFGATALVVLVVWGVVGYIFKKFTHHRGIVHSIPSGLLSGLVVFFVASRYLDSDQDAFLLGVAMMLGFVLHLVIDEFYAFINPKGDFLNPNQAFGSALKLKSHNHFITVVVYSLIVFLMSGNYSRLSNLANSFIANFK